MSNPSQSPVAVLSRDHLVQRNIQNAHACYPLLTSKSVRHHSLPEEKSWVLRCEVGGVLERESRRRDIAPDLYGTKELMQPKSDKRS